MAFRDGLLAAATQAGYVAVLDPAGGEDPLRTRVPRANLATNRDPTRGALLAEAGSTAWLALQRVPTEADPSNVAIWRLSEGHADNVMAFAAGKGAITRLSASATQRLATIGCTPSHATNCSDDDHYEVTVSRFADRIDAPPIPIVSLASPDFMGKVPLRATLSPNGQWLVVSFKSESQLMLLGLDDPSKRKWIGSNLRSINEIAFSEDGKMFAAGGCCLSEKGQSDRDQIWLWSVDKSGLTPTTLTFPLTPFAGGVQDLAFLFSRSCHHISLMTP